MENASTGFNDLAKKITRNARAGTCTIQDTDSHRLISFEDHSNRKIIVTLNKIGNLHIVYIDGVSDFVSSDTILEYIQ